MHLGRVLFPIAVTCILLVSLFCLQRETETECGQGKGQPLSFLHVTRAALACGLMLFGVLICLHTSCVRTCTVTDKYITLYYKTIILWVIHLFLLNGSVTWLYLFFLQSFWNTAALFSYPDNMLLLRVFGDSPWSAFDKRKPSQASGTGWWNGDLRVGKLGCEW